MRLSEHGRGEVQGPARGAR